MISIKRCICVAALSLGIALAMAPSTAMSGRTANPGQSNAYGASLGDWMKSYWTWFLGASDSGGAKNVTFLPIPAGTPSDDDPTVSVGELDFSLRSGQAFALPVFAFIGETYLEANVPDDDPSFLPPEIFTGARLLVKLDGKVIIDSDRDDLSEFYFDAQYFDQAIPYDQPVEYAPDVHAIGAIWVKGIGFVHPPLATGNHTLELFAYSDDFNFGFSNTWHISVGK
jgi:hypothetical protein